MLHPDADVTAISEDGCLTRGNPDHFMGPALVAFLDILGMSNAILTDWGSQTQQALWRLIRIKAGVPRDDSKSQVTVSEWDPTTDRDTEKYLTVTRTLSDSIVTMLALPSQISPPSRLTFRINCLLLNLSLIWQQALKEGFTVRGAIELGGIFWNEVDFMGTVLVNAYYLESKFTDISRIIIGPNLLNIILSIAENDAALSEPIALYTNSQSAMTDSL